VLACVRKGLSVRQGTWKKDCENYPEGAFDTVILSQTLPISPSRFHHREMLRVDGRAIVSFANWAIGAAGLSLP